MGLFEREVLPPASFGANIQSHHIFRHVICIGCLYGSIIGKFRCKNNIYGKQQFHSLFLCLFQYIGCALHAGEAEGDHLVVRKGQDPADGPRKAH